MACDTIVDFYLNLDAWDGFSANFPCSDTCGTPAYCAYGQTFQTPASPRYGLCQAKFYLSKSGVVDGFLYAKLYDVSGGLPTGITLATSNAIDCSTLVDIGGGGGWITFTFGSPYYGMLASHTYAIVVVLVDSTTFNVMINGVSNGDDGIGVWYCEDTWHTNSWDYSFYVYGEECDGGGDCIGCADYDNQVDCEANGCCWCKIDDVWQCVDCPCPDGSIPPPKTPPPAPSSPTWDDWQDFECTTYGRFNPTKYCLIKAIEWLIPEAKVTGNWRVDIHEIVRNLPYISVRISPEILWDVYDRNIGGEVSGSINDLHFSIHVFHSNCNANSYTGYYTHPCYECEKGWAAQVTGQRILDGLLGSPVGWDINELRMRESEPSRGAHRISRCIIEGTIHILRID